MFRVNDQGVDQEYIHKLCMSRVAVRKFDRQWKVNFKGSTYPELFISCDPFLLQFDKAMN